MGAWVERLGAVLLDASLGATALLGLAALAMVGCRQPARRCGLARAAILGSLALIPLALLRAGPRIEVVRPLRTFAPPPTVRRLDVIDHCVTAVRQPSPWVSGSLLAAYGTGAGLSLAWLVLGWWGTGWVARRAAAPSAETAALYESLPVAGSRRPGLAVTPRVGRPVLVGAGGGTILIPPDWERPEQRDALRLALRHELAHAERRDPWFGLAGGLAQAAWFFLPPLWWIRAQMRLDQEFLADRGASEGFGPFGTYASSLVDLADPRSATPAAAPGPRGRPPASSALFLRVLMLVRCPFPVELRAPRWWRWSVPPLFAVATLLAAGLTLRSPAATAPPPPSNPAATPGQHSFFLSFLAVDQPPPRRDGRTRPYRLLIALPDRFDLTLEVWAEAQTLPQLRVVGRRLTPPTPDPSPAPDGWHPIQIRRDPSGVTVRVDGRLLPPEPHPEPLPSSLTIQADTPQTILIRGLKLTW
jgi:hypothetical protein